MFLCNAGDIDGQISAATLTSNDLLVDAASIEVDGIDVGTIIPANSCPASREAGPSPLAVIGTLHFTTTTGWTTEYGQTDEVLIKITVVSVP